VPDHEERLRSADRNLDEVLSPERLTGLRQRVGCAGGAVREAGHQRGPVRHHAPLETLGRAVGGGLGDGYEPVSESFDGREQPI